MKALTKVPYSGVIPIVQDGKAIKQPIIREDSYQIQRVDVQPTSYELLPLISSGVIADALPGALQSATLWTYSVTKDLKLKWVALSAGSYAGVATVNYYRLQFRVLDANGIDLAIVNTMIGYLSGFVNFDLKDLKVKSGYSFELIGRRTGVAPQPVEVACYVMASEL